MAINYTNAFILASEDCPAKSGKEPLREGTVAQLQYALLKEKPYKLNSEDILFEVFAKRHAVPRNERGQARKAFFANPQACLCTSPLVKTYGWGLHHDAQSRVAAYAVDSPEYRAFAKRKDLQIVRGMRNSRKAKSGA
jgi:hypothetical protein